MIRVAICLPGIKSSLYVEQEITSYSYSHGIELSTFMIHDPSELYSQDIIQFQPDILIVSMNHMKQTLTSLYNNLKKIFPTLLTILHDSDYRAGSTLGNWSHPILTCHSYQKNDLWKTYQQAFTILKDNDTSIVYYKRPVYVSRPLGNVMYFASDARRIHMVSVNDEETFYYKMNDLEEYLQTKNNHFIRIHQSYLVNTSYIQKFDRNYILLRSGEELRISSYNRYRQLLTLIPAKRELHKSVS